jgi:hypothetical protein
MIGRHGAVDAWPPQQQSFGLSIMSAFPRNGSVSLEHEMKSRHILRFETIDGQIRTIYTDGSMSPPDLGPVTGSIPVSTMQEQITAEQEARARDTAKLARDTAEREAGRQRLNAEEAARAKEYETERRRLAAGRLPDADAR